MEIERLAVSWNNFFRHAWLLRAWAVNITPVSLQSLGFLFCPASGLMARLARPVSRQGQREPQASISLGVRGTETRHRDLSQGQGLIGFVVSQSLGAIRLQTRGLWRGHAGNQGQEEPGAKTSAGMEGRVLIPRPSKSHALAWRFSCLPCLAGHMPYRPSEAHRRWVWNRGWGEERRWVWPFLIRRDSEIIFTRADGRIKYGSREQLLPQGVFYDKRIFWETLTEEMRQGVSTQNHSRLPVVLENVGTRHENP